MAPMVHLCDHGMSGHLCDCAHGGDHWWQDVDCQQAVVGGPGPDRRARIAQLAERLMRRWGWA